MSLDDGRNFGAVTAVADGRIFGAVADLVDGNIFGAVSLVLVVDVVVPSATGWVAAGETLGLISTPVVEAGRLMPESEVSCQVTFAVGGTVPASAWMGAGSPPGLMELEPFTSVAAGSLVIQPKFHCSATAE